MHTHTHKAPQNQVSKYISKGQLHAHKHTHTHTHTHAYTHARTHTHGRTHPKRPLCLLAAVLPGRGYPEVWLLFPVRLHWR